MATWRIIPNEDDGTSRWRYRVVSGEGHEIVVHAQFVEQWMAEAFIRNPWPAPRKNNAAEALVVAEEALHEIGDGPEEYGCCGTLSCSEADPKCDWRRANAALVRIAEIKATGEG